MNLFINLSSKIEYKISHFQSHFFVYFFRTETVSPVQKITKIEKRKKIHIIVFQRTPA